MLTFESQTTREVYFTNNFVMATGQMIYYNNSPVDHDQNSDSSTS